MMMKCELALQSLDALDAFVEEQKTRARPRLDEIARRRGVLLSETESLENVKLALARDERFLRIARTALAACDKKSLEDMLEEMRGLGHYFCAYCDNETLLSELTRQLSLNAHQALNTLNRSVD